MDLGNQPVSKIDITFRSGRPFEKVPVASRMTTSLLKEGAGDLNSLEIAEKLDFFGGSLRCSAGLDISNITLYSLNKHLDELIPVMADVVLRPHFSPEEIEDLKGLRSPIETGTSQDRCGGLPHYHRNDLRVTTPIRIQHKP